MEYSDFKNLDQLAVEINKLKGAVKKKEKSLDTSYIIAKRHTKDLLSFPLILKRIAGQVITLDSVLKHPVALFKIGSFIGKSLFSRKRLA